MAFESFTDPNQRQDLNRERGARLASTPIAKYEIVSVSFATADQDTDIIHSLAPTDPESIAYIILKKSSPAVISQDQTASRKPWQRDHIFLRADQITDAVIMLFLPAPTLPALSFLTPTPTTSSDCGCGAGILAFSGFGDTPMQFRTPTGSIFLPPSTAPNTGPGCNGVVAIKPTGRMAQIGGFGPPTNPPSAVMIFDRDFSVFAVTAGGTPTGASCVRDDAGNFYGLHSSTGLLHRFDATAAVTHTWTLNKHGAATTDCVGVNGAGTRAYYTISGFVPNATTIYAWDLANDIDLGIFATESGFRVGSGTCRNGILSLSNGDVLVAWADENTTGGHIKHYDASGVTLHSYSLAGTRPTANILTPGLTDTTFWVGYYNNDLATSSKVTISEIEIGTGTVLHTFAPDDGAGFEFDGPFCLVEQFGDSGLVRKATVVLNNTQIKALPSGQLQLVPAPGAGFRLVPISCSMVARFAAGAYGNINALSWLDVTLPLADAFGYLPNDVAITNVSIGATHLTDFLDGTDKVVGFSPYQATEDLDEWGNVPPIPTLAQVENQGFFLELNNNGAGNLTGGNAANTLKVTIYYIVEEI